MKKLLISFRLTVTLILHLFRDYNIGVIPIECILLKIDSNLNVIDSLKLLNYSKKGYVYRLVKFFNYNNRLLSYGFAFDTINFKSRIWISNYLIILIYYQIRFMKILIHL